MKEFRQKAYVNPEIASSIKGSYGLGMAGFDTVFAVMGHKQNKDAIQQGEELLKNNARDFEEQMKLREQEHQQTMEQLSQQKMFIAPLVAPLVAAAAPMAVSMIPGTVISGVQGKKANKIAEEQGEAQMKQAEQFQKQQMEQQERFQKEQMKFQEQQLKTQERVARRQIRMQGGGSIQQQSTFTPPTPISIQYSEIGTCRMSGELQKEFGVGGTLAKGIKTVADRLAESKAWKGIAKTDLYKNGKGFINDVGTAIKESPELKKRAADMAGMGVTVAGLGYGVNKIIQHDAKKQGAPIEVDNNETSKPEKNGSKLKKGLAIGGASLATAGTTLVLARKGKLNGETLKSVGTGIKNAGKAVGEGIKNQFWTKASTAEEIQKARVDMQEKMQQKIADFEKKGRTVSERKLGRMQKNIERTTERMGKDRVNGWGIGMNAAFAALPAVGYIGQRQQQKDQVNEQRTYSVMSGLRGTYSKLSKGFNKSKVGGFIKRKADAIADSGFVNNWIAFGAGTHGQQKAGEKLAEVAEKSGNETTKKVSDFLTSPDHKTLRTVGGVALAAPLMFLPMQAAEGGTKKVLKAVDKNAYAYERSQEQNIQ